jgi:hypothetical protein
MSDDDFISLSIKHMLENGIKLHLDTVEEEQFYLMKLFGYFEEKTEFTPYLRHEASIEIESLDMQLLVEIMVTQGTLFFVPYASNFFDVFTETLRFISTYHEDIIRDFRGIEENKIESIDEINETIDEKTNEKETEEIEEESSSDDDYEWI